ncbi:MAG: hypothetical protein LBN34_04685 [Clostridiales Family XIII bacterium]|nr:hypothetical protein [Clostridiales Family XIII bacterium]
MICARALKSLPSLTFQGIRRAVRGPNLQISRVMVGRRVGLKVRVKGKVKGKVRAKVRGRAKFKVKDKGKVKDKDRAKVKGRSRAKVRVAVVCPVEELLGVLPELASLRLRIRGAFPAIRFRSFLLAG